MRSRLRKYGTVKRDAGITLQKLIKRDDGKCHICGKPVDIKDCSRDDRGFYITGNNYPTIDHINPLASGGSHTWDNVKLAHLYCNGAKSNNPVYETKRGQMAFAI
jgi:5-methylcytosine-specific restriction endonuclease McrA